MLKTKKIQNAYNICTKHKHQTIEEVKELNNKYQKENIFNDKINIWNAILKLKNIYDITDNKLTNVSQWYHICQVINAMEKNNTKDKLIYFAGLVHDLGKLLVLTNEKNSNIFCNNYVLQGKPQIGLDNCILTWNHDEYIYIKLRDYLPYEILWLIRYHSIDINSCKVFFSKEDLKLLPSLLEFKKFDKASKSTINFPALNEDKYINIINSIIPNEIYL